MSTGSVFQQFYAKLVKTLPMDDVLFRAELFARGLLSDNVKDHLESLSTSASKASYFLDHVISQGVTFGVGSSFDKLLGVMEESDYQGVRELAKQIRYSESWKELAEQG